MGDFVASGSQGPVILSAIAEKLKRRSEDDFKGRHFDASLIVQAVSWYLRYPLPLRLKRMPIAARHSPAGP